MSRLIAFCGIDGSGKSTQIELLHRHIGDIGKESIVVKQPSPFYRQNEYVRRRLDNLEKEIAPEFLSLFAAADRLLQQSEVIEPSLRSGCHVLMDRYVFSSYAYMYARGVTDNDWLKQLNRHIRPPDKVLYFDIDPEVALLRIIRRDGASKKKEEQDLDTMRKVRERFLQLAEEFNFAVIDGTFGIEEAHARVVNSVRNLL